MSATDTLDIWGAVEPASIAREITRMYDRWKNDRQIWETQVKELRDYLYAIDIDTTSHVTNPFQNRTSIPKLAQIYQNLVANYYEHMFSSKDWISWEAHNHESSIEGKRRAVESYIKTKARMKNLPNTFEQLLRDWIIYGNCFSELTYVNESKTDEETGETIPGYVGPVLQRISPHDIVFNVNATSWANTPKIIRSVYSIGDLRKNVKERPDLGWTQEVIDDIESVRNLVRNNSKYISNSELDKTQGVVADGFSNIMEYYNTDLVEVLVFYGDLYIGETGEFKQNHKITIVDRRIIIEDKPSESWSGSHYLYHDGWNHRPDNLYGMGPLDNLVGMQYKIDKLENLRADVFDHIAHPITVEIGNVEFFGTRGAPGGRYVAEDGGDVKYLAPDTTALQADFQIQQTMKDMEELAGSPREAMGIRSPGEKTAFEVQTLDNAANRLFRHKVNQFETNIIEPVLNDMLEMARRNLNGVDIVRAIDGTFGIEEFLSVTKEDLTAAGKLYPMGSSHFIADANMLQNIQGVFNSPLAEFMAPHISKLELAKTVENLLGIDEFKLVQENIGVLEEIETQRIAQTGQQMLEEEAVTDPRSDVDAAFAEEEQVPGQAI